MFRKNDSANASASNSVTIIGPDTSIDGDIVFTGYLRVQGKVLGNIACDSDSSGTTVVHGSGHVSGSIKSPNVVVGGQVRGAVHALESLEIQKGATLVGDARYQRIIIRAGGVVEGALMPTPASATDSLGPEPRAPMSASPAMDSFDLADAAPAQRPFWSATRLGLAAVLAIVAATATVAWLRQAPTTSEPSRLAAAPPSVPLAQDSPVAQSAPPAIAPPPVVTSVAAAPAVPDIPATTATTAESQAGVPAADQAVEDPGKIVTVKGMEAEKPVGFFFVETREAAVLYIKNRNEAGEGTRLEFPRRTKKKISIAKNEVVRVAQGRNTTIFYQGRKASPSTIESGAWIGFVPAARNGDQ